MPESAMPVFEQGIMVIELFGLVLARVFGIFIQGPVFQAHQITMRIRVGAAIVIAIALFPVLPMPAHLDVNLLQFFYLLIGNVIVGLMIGYTANLPILTLQFAGELLDIQLGLTIASSFDPMAGGTVNLIRRFELYLCIMTYLIINGHHYLFKALYRAFQVVPVTGFHFRGAVFREYTFLTSEMFKTALEISAPPLAALFITQMALGLVARASPQMNVFMLSFPVNLWVGLTLLAVTLPIIIQRLGPIFTSNYYSLLKILLNLQPGG